MNASAIISEATRRGIRLAVLGDGLKVNAPKDAFDPEFRLRLVAAKPDIIRLLTPQNAIEADEAPSRIPTTPDAIFPEHRKVRWASLIDQGVAEGIEPDEARRLATQIILNEIECDRYHAAGDFA